MSRRKGSEALYLGQRSSDYLNLLSEMLKYCCPIEILQVKSKENCVKAFFPRTQQNNRSKYKIATVDYFVIIGAPYPRHQKFQREKLFGVNL